MPAGLQVERGAKSPEARVRIPVPRKRNSSATVLQPIVALLLETMANADGNTLETSGFEFRPTDRKIG